jgi:hypothetical protein
MPKLVKNDQLEKSRASGTMGFADEIRRHGALVTTD